MSPEGASFYAWASYAGLMSGLSDNDLERIRSFVNTPRYKRSPDQLRPEDMDEDDDE